MVAVNAECASSRRSARLQPLVGTDEIWGIADNLLRRPPKWHPVDDRGIARNLVVSCADSRSVPDLDQRAPTRPFDAAVVSISGRPDTGRVRVCTARGLLETWASGALLRPAARGPAVGLAVSRARSGRRRCRWARCGLAVLPG